MRSFWLLHGLFHFLEEAPEAAGPATAAAVPIAEAAEAAYPSAGAAVPSAEAAHPDKVCSVRVLILYSATSANGMPYISPMVDVDGTPCLDGGCSCKIPYKWALDEGYEKIVIVRTREPEYRKKVNGKGFPINPYNKYPEFSAKLEMSNSDYNRQCEKILELEKSGRVFVLYPSSKVTISRLEGDMEKLGALYWQGYNDTLDRLDMLRENLVK